MGQRRTIAFSGRVQGVGFRMTAVEMAQGLQLGGTVQNLPDGDVELVVEGNPRDIDALVQRLREHFGAFIRTISQDASPGTGLLGRGVRILH